MDYKLIIRPEARSELLDIFQWYQEQRSGLGFDFKLCVDEIFSKLIKHSSIYKKIYNDIRKAVTQRFPFGIFYLINNDHVIILAVLHARRDPENWN
ncbi:hypothetical protein MNBD_GAMMA21-1499 [hydrothermal vent metagenome]|uniref:Death on curing protein, Doc toxin n=1 Tax=hydrothermal vent metagenome TaxID=652676 RepID=A0A3B1A209_9ZZZZ